MTCAVKIVVGCIMSLSIVVATAQDEEEACVYPTDKAVVKLLEKAQDSKKYNFQERYKFLKDATEEDEECAWCWFELGMANYAKNNSEMFGSFENSKAYLLNAISLCENIHSDTYYYLGVIYYGEGDDVNCLKYFRKFLDFPTDDPDRVGRSYENQYTDVEEIIPEIEFYAEFFQNEVPFNPYKVEGVSSYKDDYLPMLSPDNSIMLLTRKFDTVPPGPVPQTIKMEQLTICERANTSSNFNNGKAFEEPFNAGYNYGGISISVDNKEMYITICQPTEYKTSTGQTASYNNCDIYVSRWSKHTDIAGETYFRWSDPENLGPNVNEELAWESQPSLSGDGQTLYFAKISANTDSTDIYISKRQEDGTWGLAQSIGAPINGVGNEKSPFIHSDSETLYFAASSNIWRMGAGGFDIYYSKYVDGIWTEPKNLGYPINTKGHEHGLFVSGDGHLAYFSSNSLQGAQGYDVFAFELYEDARPEVIQIVTGTVKNEKNEIVADAEITFTYISEEGSAEDPVKEFTVAVDEETGEYAAVVTLHEDADVLMTIESETEEIPFNSHVFHQAKPDEEIATDDAELVVKLDLEVQEVKVNEPYTINDIIYNTNSADLHSESKTVLKGFAKYLNENPHLVVEIRGHTDNIGDADYNKSLSADRAFTVKAFLAEHGVDGSRISFAGYGEELPKVPNDNDANRAINRRTEFVITSM